MLDPGSIGIRVQDKQNVTVLATMPPAVLGAIFRVSLVCCVRGTHYVLRAALCLRLSLLHIETSTHCAAAGERAAGVKFTVGGGTVYHFICELCEREVRPSLHTFIILWFCDWSLLTLLSLSSCASLHTRVLTLLSTQRVTSDPKKAVVPFLQQHNASKATIQVWECAAKCGFPGATPIAQSAYPLMLLISYIALQHKQQWKVRTHRCLLWDAKSASVCVCSV